MEESEISAIINKSIGMPRPERIAVAREVGCHPCVVDRTIQSGLSRGRGYWIRLKILYALQKRINDRT